jgi:exonuclease VII small subunit
MVMDNNKEDAYLEEGKVDPQEQHSDSTMEILNRVESGELDVEDAVKHLRGEEGPEKKVDILDQLEQGHIDVEEAIHRLEGALPSSVGGEATGESSFAPSDGTSAPRKWRDWWLVILASSLAVIALTGWLGTLGGWWWLCAGPGLILGFVLLVVALASKNAPWLHLRVDTGQQTWPRHIALSFPLPIRLASWGLKTWGSRIPNLSDTAVDELILALEGNLSSDSPIYIEVQEDETTGERVQIFLG